MAETEVRKKIPIDRIIEDETLHVRVKINPMLVDKYRDLIREQGYMDPVHVFRSEDGKFILTDGYHRLRAYRAEKHETIPSEIHEGTKSEALEFAIKATCHAGAACTNADKRRAASLAVLDPKIAKYADKRIAYMIGVSPTLVGDVRRGESPKAKRERHKAIKDKKSKSKGDGPALISVSAHERKAPEKGPSSEQCLHQIIEWVNADIISEEDVLGVFRSGSGEWVWQVRKAK